MPDPTPPADPVTRALGDTLDGSRPRRPEDAADPGIPIAATVVLVRDGAAGPEVLLLERPDRGSFAGAWVFPGGKVDAADRRAEADEGADTGDGRQVRADAAVEGAAAVRAAVRETQEETGLVVVADDLVPVSVWDPPPGIALRIRTWFFAVAAPPGVLTLSPAEAVAAQWLRPSDALARHARGALTLYPPTWVTLHDLQHQPDAGTLIAALRIGGPTRFETVAQRTASGPVLLWQGDADYEDAAASDPRGRHRLEIGALPWRFTRT